MTRGSLRGRDSYGSWDEIRTRWLDNDIYGHVNNAAYYAWFDTVVNNWLIASGLLVLDVRPLIGLVVQSSCRYVSSLSYPDTVEIGLATERVGHSSVTYRLGAFRRGEDAASAEGFFTHVYVDGTTRRPVALPENWRAVLATLSADPADPDRPSEKTGQTPG